MNRDPQTQASPLACLKSVFLSPYLILVSAVVMQMCLGATYSWSVFVSPLKDLTGLRQGPLQLPLSFFYLAFPITVLFSGYLMTRLGPRLCAVIGGMLFGAGWVVASLGGSHFQLVVSGIGILAGIGVGFAYLVPISTCIQWFPKRKGLVTGIAVAGFGGGAALVSQFSNYLMEAQTMTPFSTFRLLGIIFFVLVCLTGLAMRRPPDSNFHQIRPLPWREVIQAKPFQILFVAMFAGLAAGFAVNGNLKQLHYSPNPMDGVMAVSLFAIANAAGRVVWGTIFDRFSAGNCLKMNLFAQAVVLLGSFLLLNSNGGHQTFAILTGFNYGGVLVLYASTVAHVWGPERVGQVYGWLFSSNVPAALGPLMTGIGYDLTGSFTLPLTIIGGILITASFVVHLAWRDKVS